MKGYFTQKHVHELTAISVIAQNWKKPKCPSTVNG